MRVVQIIAAALMLLAADPALAAKRPKLVAVIVIDQYSWDALQGTRSGYGKAGIERLMSEGFVFSDAHYRQQNTYTGPGHATISSGSYAYKNGIVSNKYFDRVQKKSFTMMADPRHPVLEAPADPEDDCSPATFTGEGLGDRMRVATDLKSKVVTVALKDRGAVMLAGRLGTAYWFSEATGKMTSSTYYTKELPAWVKAFNDKRIPDSYFGKSWDRAMPESWYMGKDNLPWEDEGKGLGKVFPHPLTGRLDKPGPDFYSAFATSGYGPDFTVAFAKAAIEAEGLGKDDVPDLIGVSFSSNDFVGHSYGPESHEYQDLAVRADRAIADLLASLEKAAGGKQNLVVGFIADHGATPTPEYMASLGYPAGRIKKATIKEAINAELRARFGDGEWVAALEDPNVFLNADLIAERKIDPVAAQEVAGQAVMRIPGFAAYFTRAQLLEGLVPATPIGQAVQLSFHPERSGDVVLLCKPFYFWGKYGEKNFGSTHGSPYRYDTHIPMVFWGAGIKAGTFRGQVDAADFAPTLAAALGLSAPAGADGEPRPEIFR